MSKVSLTEAVHLSWIKAPNQVEWVVGLVSSELVALDWVTINKDWATVSVVSALLKKQGPHGRLQIGPSQAGEHEWRDVHFWGERGLIKEPPN